MRRLEVHPEVYEELEEARAWYEEHAVGLGDEFLSEVEGAISVIQRSPEAWPIYRGDFLSIAFLSLSYIEMMR